MLIGVGTWKNEKLLPCSPLLKADAGKELWDM